MRILFLDDDQGRHEVFLEKLTREGYNVDELILSQQLHMVWDAPSCIEKLKTNKYDEAHLDHDLGMLTYVDVNHENTGSAVCRFIAQDLPVENYPKKVIIHSWNHHGALNMESLLKGVGISTIVHRFVYR